MEKELLKKKFGLPPMPPIGPGAPPRRNFQRKRDYTPRGWGDCFQSQFEVDTQDGNKFCVYTRGSEGPVLLFLHGGGFSALSWALLAVELTSMVKCQCVAVDQRGHGDTKTIDDSDLSAEQLSTDIGNLVSHLYPDEAPPIILVGHSMGGAVAVHAADRNLIPSLIGLAVIDVVEGTAMDALSSMQSFLRNRPRTFESMERAIEWAVKSGQIQNVESAKISMAGQLKPLPLTSEPEFKEPQSGSFNDVIKEEDEEDEDLISPSSSSSTSTTQSGENKSSEELALSSNQVPEMKGYTWRIDLSKTEKFWKGWFTGLSLKFLSCSPAKILILAGPDRLDKDMTIGQMQGKFQMNLLPQCGHAVHEDVPVKVAEILASFLLRQRVAEPLAGFERPVPCC